MPNKPPKIVPLATALAALVGAAPVISDAAEARTAEPADLSSTGSGRATAQTANSIVSVGENLLGFIVTKAADGSVLAQHELHYSHSSHASHSSHSSSSY